MKKVKTKKRKFKYRLFLYAFLVFCGYQVSFNIIMNLKLASGNDEFIKCLLADSNYHLLYEKKANNLLNRAFSYFFDINEPVSILENTFHFKANNDEATGYVSNPTIDEVKADPLIYIYNTHQSEGYQGDALKGYNIKPGVMMASYILKDKLSKEGVSSIVLEDNLIDYLNLNNMRYSASYKVSRKFIEPVIKGNSSFKLIVDLHRDSIAKEKSTLVINNKSCAKVVFVIGNEYDNYEENLKVANTLNNMIKEKYPSLTRGVMIKGGKGSNGVYNQDISSKMVLLEMGSDSNTIDEVLNTIELLAPILKEYVNGA